MAHITFNEQVCRAVIIEDNAGGLNLFVLDTEGHVFYAHPYGIGTAVDSITGHKVGKSAAEDWVGLIIKGIDPMQAGWDGNYDVASGQRDYDCLMESNECSIIADTDDINENDPFGLCFHGGYSARDFFLFVTEGVSEYAKERERLLDE